MWEVHTGHQAHWGCQRRHFVTIDLNVYKIPELSKISIMKLIADNFVHADYDKAKRLMYCKDGETVKTYIPVGGSFIVLDKEEGTVFNAQEWRWSDGKTSESLYHLVLTKDSNPNLIAKINWLKSCRRSVEADYSAIAMRTEPAGPSQSSIDYLYQHREEFAEQLKSLNLIRAFNKVINYFKSELLPGTVESNIEYNDLDVGQTGKDVILMKKEYFESRFEKQFLI